jgi:hypothetical protein
MRGTGNECHFDEINGWVTQQYGGFFTKDFVFEVLDELN